MGVGVISLPGSCGGRGGRCPPSPSPGVASPRIEFAIPPPPPTPPPLPRDRVYFGGKRYTAPVSHGRGGGDVIHPPPPPYPGSEFFFRTSTRCPPPPDRACFGSGGVQPPVTYARHRVHRCIDGVGIILFPLATQPPTPGRLCSEPHGNPLPPSTGGRGFSPSPPPLPPPLPSPGTLRAWMFRARSSPPPYPTPGSSLFFGDGGVDPGPRSEFIFSGYEKVHTGTASVSPSRGHGGKRRLFTRAGGRNHPSTPIPPRPP